MSEIIPVSRERHGRLAWNKAGGFAHVRGERAVAVGLLEAMQLMMYLPLAFIRQESHYTLVALLGLRAGENLWVGGDNRWLGPRVPATLQHYPFRLLRSEEGQELLGVDVAGLAPPGPGMTPLFDAEGKPAPELSTILEQLSAANRERLQTRQTVALLQQHDLLEPWPLRIHEGDSQRTVDGLLRVAEKKIAELAPQDLAALRDGGALTLAYMQLLSMQHVQQLMRMAVAYAAAKQQTQAGKDLALEHGLISFANL